MVIAMPQKTQRAVMLQSDAALISSRASARAVPADEMSVSRVRRAGKPLEKIALAIIPASPKTISTTVIVPGCRPAVCSMNGSM